MAEHSFSLEFRGVMFDVVLDYIDDPAEWSLRSARPHDDDANFAGWLVSNRDTCTDFYRQCEEEMQQVAASGGVDPMDVAKDKHEEAMQ